MLDCEGRAKPAEFASSALEAGSRSESRARLLRLDRSRSVRPCAASALTLGALGKNCAKLTPSGGRVIVSMRSGYRLHRDLVMISRVRAQAIHDTKTCGRCWPSHATWNALRLSPRDREAEWRKATGETSFTGSAAASGRSKSNVEIRGMHAIVLQ